MQPAARLSRTLAATTIFAVALLGAWQARAQAQSLEFPVKANYLVRFAAFVGWPDGAFASPQAPLSICISGTDPFGDELDKAAHGQSAHDRPIQVRRLAGGDPAAGCQIVYVGRGSQISAAAIKALQAQPVLIVTDEANGAAQGAIHFVIRGDRVRFDVDQSILPHGMVIDSRLLSLALSVRGAS